MPAELKVIVRYMLLIWIGSWGLPTTVDQETLVQLGLAVATWLWWKYDDGTITALWGKFKTFLDSRKA